MTNTCALCPNPLPGPSMCHHARWLCATCCWDHCLEEDE